MIPGFRKLGSSMSETEVVKPKSMLFLCTGNYYRSRFAESLFNHFAEQRGLDWQGSSRGLAVERGVNNVGPISQHTLAGLSARGIALVGENSRPRALKESDLARAHHIVAVNRAEHLPILERKFPLWVEQVEFWHVQDCGLATPDEALAQIERNVLWLINRFASEPRLKLT
jgi:protein-tyrosine phosphatase